MLRLQVVDTLCPSCLQQQRQLKRIRLRFSMAALNSQAPGIFGEPEVEVCVICDARVRELFSKIAAHVGVRTLFAVAFNLVRMLSQTHAHCVTA